MTSTTQTPGGDPLEQAMRAALDPAAGRTAADGVGRGGPLREDGTGIVAGVCAALARATGTPVRLVRLTAVLLALLGPGIPLYLLGMLLIARRTDRAEAPGGVETPLRALIGGAVRGVDVLALVLLLPALPLSLLWLLLLAVDHRGVLAALGSVALVLLLLLGLAARRAVLARRALVLAALARRAGIIEDAQLGQFLLEQRRRAPWAWQQLGRGEWRSVLEVPGDSAVTGADGSGSGVGLDPGTEPGAGATPARWLRRGRGSRPRRPRASGRTVLAVLAGMLAALALGMLVTNLRPDLVPALDDPSPLPQVGRIGTGFALATLVAGAALVVLGARGRRSLLLLLAGVLALAGTGAGAAWLRLTQDTGLPPLVISAEDFDPMRQADCPDPGATWGRSVIVDLSSVTAADVGAWRTQQLAEGGDPQPVIIGCDVLAGRTTLRMPEDDSLLRGYLGSSWSGIEVGTGGDETGIVIYWTTLVGTVEVVDVHGEEVAG